MRDVKFDAIQTLKKELNERKEQYNELLETLAYHEKQVEECNYRLSVMMYNIKDLEKAIERLKNG